MVHYDVELVYDQGSRDLSVGFLTGQQQLVLGFCLDETIEPIAPASTTLYGYNRDVVALEFAYAVFPPSRLLPSPDPEVGLILFILTDIKLTEKADNYWQATGIYTVNKNSGVGFKDFELGQDALPYVQMHFTIGGGSRKVFKNLDFVEAPILSDSAGTHLPAIPDVLVDFGTIGFTEDTLAGVEIPTFDLRVQITGYYRPQFVNLAFVNEVKAVMCGDSYYGTYNDALFMEQQIGEVSLVGTSGGAQVQNIKPITFEFSVIKNIAARQDSGFPSLPAHFGHDLLEYSWFRKFDDAAKKIVSTPDVRSIHRIKDSEDYSRLKLPL